MPRKSPYEHRVTGHIRSGVQVSEYKRGKGKKPKKPRKIITKAESKAFNVRIDGRSYSVEAVTFASALNIGLSKTTIVPTNINIRRQNK